MGDLDFSGKIAAVDPEGGWKKYREYSSTIQAFGHGAHVSPGACNKKYPIL
jgi:hypothetical protein